MADTRNCEQCGTAFEPRREHARFCSAACRVAWNSEHTGDRAAGVSALDWSITAMGEATGRLSRVRAVDRARAFGAVAEAVWWVTIVDATLVRYYPGDYDEVLCGQVNGERQLVNDTLAGLRFVRNQMGDAIGNVDFVRPGASWGKTEDGGITAWLWNPVPEPVTDSLQPRAQAWEMSRYQAYQHQLAGHTIGETFARASAFLKLAAMQARRDAETAAQAGNLPSGRRLLGVDG
jgi:hypothetical protein